MIYLVVFLLISELSFLKFYPSVEGLLSSDAHCIQDYETHCPFIDKKSDFEVFVCLKFAHFEKNGLTKDCSHTLWEFQLKMTKSDHFKDLSYDQCHNALKNLPDCSPQAPISQKMHGTIYCLMQYKNSINDTNCKFYLNQIARFIFSDYSLMRPFLDQCEADIKDLKCGRLSINNSTSQSDVMECLTSNYSLLQQPCRNQLFRVAEMSSDDYQLDTALYYACRDSREILCKNVRSGEGRIYKCLYDNKFNSKMDTLCRHKLVIRQKLRDEDYHIDYSLQMCAFDIEKYCNSQNDPTKNKLGTILLCLESKEKMRISTLQPECATELKRVRKQLMEDYQISPELLHNCYQELKSFCSVAMTEQGGKAIHCLIRKLQNDRSPVKNPEISVNCRSSVSNLMKIVDPSSLIFVDPIIESSCSNELSSNGNCHNNNNPYECIYQLAINPQYANRDSVINSLCKQSILEVAYILSRKFFLHDSLFKSCKREASKMCKVHEDWQSINQKDDGIVFSCLRKSVRTERKNFTDICVREMFSVIKNQASRIQLNPMLYDSCLTNLGSLCSKSQQGEEYICLQNNLEQLDESCKTSIVEFSRVERSKISLDVILSMHCRHTIDTYCRNAHDNLEEEDEDDDSEENENDEQQIDKKREKLLSRKQTLYHCLIEHKNSPETSIECSSSIHHHQILGLKEIKISKVFYEACKKNADLYCNNYTTKAEIISCLSTKQLDNVLEKHTDQIKASRLSPECSDALKFELLQRSENIMLDPILQAACKQDVDKFCSKITEGKSKVIECLKSHHDSLSSACENKLFRREQLDSIYNYHSDSKLLRQCHGMIFTHCAEEMRDISKDLLFCLVNAIERTGDFDAGCKSIVYNRVKLQRRDFRLDPTLMKYCSEDIDNKCNNIVVPILHKDKENMDEKNSQYKGRILRCLKDNFKKTKSSKGPALSPKCQEHIRHIIIIDNLNFHLDPILAKSCEKEVQEFCSTELGQMSGDFGDGRVVECLKHKFLERKFKMNTCHDEVSRLISEQKADIHVDVILYRACNTELKSFCKEVELGAGQMMECLVSSYKTNPRSPMFSSNCVDILHSRIEMWGELSDIKDLSNLYRKITSRDYFLYAFLLIFLSILAVGVCCGRLTKRVRYEAKIK